MLDLDRLLCDRARQVDASGIRRVFELGAKLSNPINLSIGQPDFPVPDAIKQAAIEAIKSDHNGYTLTQGIGALIDRLTQLIKLDVGWDVSGLATDSKTPVMVTSGTSGGLLLAFMSLLGPCDEVIIPDPYFVMYPHLATMCDARAVLCDTYPEMRMTADLVEPLITDRTKIVLINSPSNPAGAVLSRQECSDLLDLCRAKGLLLISDEIYDVFTYSESRSDVARGDQSLKRCPSPARFDGAEDCVLLVRGFGKTYGVTGWRMGYVAGPRPILEAMSRFQQYTFVCAPAPAQWGALAALDVDMADHVGDYERRRDLVVDQLSQVTEVPMPGGAFYAFAKVPEHLGITASEFVERCVEKSVLVIPGSVFSSRDTHIRLSYATDEASLMRGLSIVCELMSEG